MNFIKDGWFSEVSEKMWPGEARSLQVKKVLFHERSKFQDVLVFESTNYGNVLVLDGCIQITDRDEFSYHEMIAHTPLFAHKNPKKVLVIGGGDGGVVREVAKHKCVEKIVLCEIDKMVVDVSKKYFPKVSSALVNDKRVEIIHEDGAKYLAANKDSFDVIIVDSSDPVGPAESLFGPEFYKSAYQALKPDGIICSLAECFWLFLDLVAKMISFMKEIFESVEYNYVSTPAYVGGICGFTLCRKGKEKCNKPVREIPKELEDQLLFYNKEVHEASFKIPSFAKRKFQL